jgi:glycosyltransferase involved in cell wall biosynthesis
MSTCSRSSAAARSTRARYRARSPKPALRSACTCIPRSGCGTSFADARIEIIKTQSERELLERLPRERALVLTQSPISVQSIERMATRHGVTGFAHMPMFQRSAETLQGYQLVFTVSRYCIELLHLAGLRQVYPEPVYGTADLARGSEALIMRSPYIVDPRKFRDVLIGGYTALKGFSGRRKIPYRRRPGLTLGLVSLIAPIKQFAELFAILAPILARKPTVNPGRVRRRRLCPGARLAARARATRERARFWGFQSNVGAIYPQLDYLMTGLPEKEALGLNALEAQSCGTPVLAPDAPPFTETIVDGAAATCTAIRAQTAAAISRSSSMRSSPAGRGSIRASRQKNISRASRMPRWWSARTA